MTSGVNVGISILHISIIGVDLVFNEIQLYFVS